MGTLTKAGIVALSLAGGTASVASAANNWPGNTAHVCGGDKFQTCASISLSWTGSVVTLVASNLGSFGEAWDAIGLFNLPQCWGVGGNCHGNNTNWTYVQNSGPAHYSAGNQGFAGAGITKFVGASNVSTNPAANGIQNGFGGTWMFTFSGYFNQTQFDAGLNAAGVGIHAVSGPNDCSTKLAVLPTGAAFQNLQSPLCASTIVPEPMSLTLLATGLVGLVGIGVIRRRRRAVPSD